MRTAMHMIFLAAALLSAGGPAGAQANKVTIKNKDHMTTTIQANKEVIRALYEKALNGRDFGLLSGFISEAYTGAGGQKGAAGFEGPVSAVIKAFPDVQWHIEELIGEGDKVFVRWTWKGTHTGTFRQLAATGKIVSNEGSAVYELKEGKVTGSNVQTDRLGFLQQLDVLPADPAALSAAGTVRFIDRFVVPANATATFLQRMKSNRDFLRTLPGFIKDEVYKHPGEDGSLVVVTIAAWESKEALEKAQESVQAFYSRTGFQPAAFLKEAGIQIERGIYRSMEAPE